MATEKKSMDEQAIEKAPWTEEHLAPYMRAGLTLEDSTFLHSYDSNDAAAAKIYRKVDVRLCPMLAALYLASPPNFPFTSQASIYFPKLARHLLTEKQISHLDRANIGNAKIEGLESSLGMTGTDYNVALAIFFVPYVLCEVPSNMLLAKFTKPSLYMAILILCWGIVMTLSGVVQNFGGLVATRFFLGLFEAGFFPGAIYLVGQWYPPSRTQFRMSLFYCASACSGAFSGLLAAGIAKMNGLGGQEGWRWIFIIEGLATVLMAVACYYFLPDSPALAAGKWLTQDEARYLQLTHIYTRGLQKKPELDETTGKAKFQWSILWQVLTDWQLYLQALVFASNAVPNYGLKFTMPQIIRNMGFTSTRAQLLTAPPYFCGAISALVSSLMADRFKWRMPFIVSSQSLLIIAYGILFAKAEDIADNVPLCYFAVFVACVGIYPILPGCNAWTINNLAGPEKRAMGIAFMICMGNLGGIVGSFIYLEKEKPKYPTGFGSSLAFAAAGIVAALTLETLFVTINKKNAKYTEEDIRRKYTEAQLEKMGDRSPLFKYHL